MVDKILGVDPTRHRIQETDPDREGRDSQSHEHDEESRKKEKDKFARDKESWKNLVTDPRLKMNPTSGARLATGEKPSFSLTSPASNREESFQEEMSLSMSQRLLVLWGVMDTRGKPRVQVIGTYVLVIGVIAVSVFLVIRILWR